MTLAEYLEKQGRGAIEALARRADCSRNSIVSARDGHAPSVRLARQISAATGGEVTVLELLGLAEKAAS